MSYWAVWPIGAIQLFAFVLMFVRRTWRPLNVSVRIWVVVLLMLANLFIVISILHDAVPINGIHF